jgi:hypothetical protein
LAQVPREDGCLFLPSYSSSRALKDWRGSIFFSDQPHRLQELRTPAWSA